MGIKSAGRTDREGASGCVDIPGLGERELPRSLPLAWELVHVAFAVAAFVLVHALMPGMPERIAIHFDMAGNANGWIDRGPAAYLLPVGIIALLAVCLAFCHHELLSSRASASESSPAAAYGYAAFARAQSFALVGLGALYDAVFLLMPLQMAGLVSVDSCMVALIAACVVTVVACIVMAVRYGNNGRRIAQSLDLAAPPLADDSAHWTRWGMYRNAEDPRLWVPKRFGMGMTINAAQPLAWVQFAAVIAAILAIGFSFFPFIK